jgi:DNA (cytosine-5)-methyltransferase 1
MDDDLNIQMRALETNSPCMAVDRRPTKSDWNPTLISLSISGLFAGIGGFEEGFRRQGHHSLLLCETDPTARRVLAQRFPDVQLTGDIRELASIPDCDVITAGFPCQDLSQVGRTKGISGPESSLINEVLRLLQNASAQVKWLVLENVPFMLHLHKGRAIHEITRALTDLGWQWAYRTLDTRAFGLPQRRRRLFLLASRTEDPRPALLGVDAGEKRPNSPGNSAYGFYWTEGHRGLGWAINAIPPLKGGSSLAIPAPPAIWFPSEHAILVPSIEDAEKLQGFSPGWTQAARLEPNGERSRWRLVGNAVSVPVAEWLADRLCQSTPYYDGDDGDLRDSARWPDAAWCVDGRLARSNVSAWPVNMPVSRLMSFMNEARPLSLTATAGFLARLEHSQLRRNESFIEDLHRHVANARTEKESKSVDPKVSRRMAATRGKNNPAELALRSALHRQGFRFRVHLKLLCGLQRTADIAFPSLRVAIFLDGCFWHGCPIHATWPKTNATSWLEKITQNRRRDRDTDEKLKADGWTVVRVWEHEDATPRITLRLELTSVSEL